MSYWISVVSPDWKHHETGSMNMSCSWNYSNMMSALPCGWAYEWQGKKAIDMINPVYASIVELNVNPEKYKKYEIEPEHDLGSIKICKEILHDALDLFQKHPDDIIRVE